MSDVHVKGLAELQKVLNELPANIERNVLRGALRAGAQVFQRAARAGIRNAEPSDKNRRLYGGRIGLLRDSVCIAVTAKNGQVKAITKAGGKVKGGGDAYYATWVEKGTKPHDIKVVKAKALSVGGWVATKVHHPGARPHPFMTPAFDTSHREAVIAMREYIRKRLATKHGVTVPAPEGES